MVQSFVQHGENLKRADGSARSVVIFLFDGMTAQDFIGVYSVLNFASGEDHRKRSSM